MEDRRHFQRFNVSLRVRYRVVEWNETNIALCTNIGRLGVCLITNERVSEGTQLDLEFSPLDEDTAPPIVIKGEAVWSREIALPKDFFELYFREYSPHIPFEDRYRLGGQYYETGIRLVDLSSYMWIKLFQYIPALEMFDEKWSIDVRCRDCVYYHETGEKTGHCFGIEVNGDSNPKDEQCKGRYFIPKR